MDQRLRFLDDVRLGRMSMMELCAHAQISWMTGYSGSPAKRRRDGVGSRIAAADGGVALTR